MGTVGVVRSGLPAAAQLHLPGNEPLTPREGQGGGADAELSQAVGVNGDLTAVLGGVGSADSGEPGSVHVRCSRAGEGSGQYAQAWINSRMGRGRAGGRACLRTVHPNS